VLFSSHQLDLVEDVCRDVVVIERGRVVLAGPLEDLRAASRLRYLEVGFRESVTWTPRLEGARVVAAEPGRTRLELAGGDELEELLTLARSGRELTRFSFEPPALSDLFREAVGR
jgi:ABC-2 type transport system ATP-binding protein